MGYRAGVVGAAGFAGIELVRLLSRHPEFDLAAVTSDALAGTPIAKAYPAFTGVTDLAFSTHEDTDFSAFDVVFLAVPHKAALGMATDLMAAGVTVVDLSADFRLKDPAIYEKWYAPHTATDLLAQAAFGLPELTGDELAAAAERRAAGEAVLVGCAGCYPTATSLAAAPAIRAGLVDAAAPVVADAVSGVTGAGKKATERTHYCFANENLEAYGVGTHRHTPEIEQILGLEGRLVFTPRTAVHGDAAAGFGGCPHYRGARGAVSRLLHGKPARVRHGRRRAAAHGVGGGNLPRPSGRGGTPRRHDCGHRRHRQPGEGRGWPGRAVRQHRVRPARDLRFGRDRQPRVKLEGDEGRVGAVPWEREDL